MATASSKARNRTRYEAFPFRVYICVYLTDPTIIHCPIVSCQQPVLPPPPALDGRPSEWDRLRMCECGFAFCMYCRRAWHGPHTSCSLLTTAEFVQMYLQYPENSTERLIIEKRHGKANVLKLVANFEEEQLNRAWMEKETMMYVHPFVVYLLF